MLLLSLWFEANGFYNGTFHLLQKKYCMNDFLLLMFCMATVFIISSRSEGSLLIATRVFSFVRNSPRAVLMGTFFERYCLLLRKLSHDWICTSHLLYAYMHMCGALPYIARASIASISDVWNESCARLVKQIIPGITPSTYCENRIYGPI